MKANRYIQPTTQYESKRTPSHHHLIAKSQQEKATIKTLLYSYKPHQHYNLSCNKQIGLYITSLYQSSKLNINKSKGQLVVKRQTLKELFRKFLLQPNRNIMFKADTPHHIQQTQHYEYEIPKNYFSLSKTTCQAQQCANTTSQESNRRNNFNNKNATQISLKDNWPSGQSKMSDNKKLTIVEQVKQSSQSQAQQYQKQQQKQTKYNFSQVHSNLKFNKNITKKQQPSKKIFNQQNQHKLQQIQRKPFQSLANMNFDRNKQIEQVDQKRPNVQPRPNNTIQINSFGVQIRKGLIQHDSFQPIYQNSLKIAGIGQIQKELNQKLSSNQISQISELSSIISTGRPQINGHPNNNSLTNDIAIIDYESRSEIQKQINQKDNPFSKKQNRYIQPANNTHQQQQSKVQKINLSAVAQKREMEMDDNIEITQKQKEQSWQSQFTVKYNVRFLQKKKASTEVVRLSPLRFRGKSNVAAGKVQKTVYENKPST